MQLTFRSFDTLPRLAWCARLLKTKGAVEVLHGPWVETASDFFCEGAWSGNFISHEFDTCLLMGSGGRITGNNLLISTPNHTLERIFLLRYGKTLLVSNSLAFILASAHDSVSPRALLYSVKLASITNGLKNYARWLPTRDGHKVRMYYHCNLLIDSNLNVIEEPKRAVQEFDTFADYKEFLFERVRAIHENANDPHRKVIYRPITTISSGYDSPAAAVLAQSIGCTEGLTFTQSRGETSGVTSDVADTGDSGAEIAARLGMQAHVFDRLDYLKEEGFPEAEFFGWGAQESPWAKHLEGRILFTGYHGDKVWDIHGKIVSTHIVRGDPSGHNLNAFRLRVGWIHLPLPFLGCTSHPSIHRISASKEMEPWSLGNEYDRPIPRRLIEEAGVDRQMFGMTKKATGLVLQKAGFSKSMTKESADGYSQYYSKHWNAWMTIKQRVFMLLRTAYYRNNAYNKQAAKLLAEKTGLHVDLPILIPRELRFCDYGDLDTLSLLVHWSIEKLLPYYTFDTCAEPLGDVVASYENRNSF